MRYQAVPSLAIAQLRVPVDDVEMFANRLLAETVFGVFVANLNVKVLRVFFDHAPVNVQIRNTLF